MFDSLKLSKRLTEHDEALEKVQRRLTALEVEWADTLDRLKTMMGRILKERQTATKIREELGQMPTQQELTDEDIGAGHTTLNSRQQTINERILARRNRMGGTQ